MKTEQDLIELQIELRKRGFIAVFRSPDILHISLVCQHSFDCEGYTPEGHMKIICNCGHKEIIEDPREIETLEGIFGLNSPLIPQ